MKKLLAMLLSVIMALPLAVPALAAPAPGASLEDIIPISGTLDGLTGSTGGSGASVYVDEEACRAYLEANPEAAARFRANAYDFFGQMFFYYESPEEYMETWELTEEEFLDEMAMLQAKLVLQAQAVQGRIDALKEAMGGVPGQIGVMLNGAYVQFPDAVPEVTGGRTMVPVRPIVEALGGQAEMADGKVICEAGGVRLTFTPGSKEVLTEYTGGELPGDGQMFPMDCAPYIKGGRTYVPVRFLGEILGYKVGWDGQFETAVLTDPEALKAEIDSRFTIYNRLMATQGFSLEDGKALRADMKGDLTFTAFDTLNGNTTYTARLTGEELVSSEAYNGSYALALSDNLAEALVELLEEEGLTEEEAAPLRAALRQLELDYIATREGLAWMHSPVLDELGGGENVWLGVAMGPNEAAALFAQLGQTATVGGQYLAAYDFDSVLSWAAAMEGADASEQLLGDRQFTTAGGVSTLRWDLDALIDWVLMDYDTDEFTEEELAGLRREIAREYKDLEYTLTVDSRGSGRISALVHTLPQHLGDSSMRMAVEETVSAGRVVMTVDLHIANVGQFKLTLESARQGSAKLPITEPPEGSTIVDPIDPLNP